MDTITLDRLTDEEFGHHVMALLLHELGPMGYVRYLQLFGAGLQNYTEEREQNAQALQIVQVLRTKYPDLFVDVPFTKEAQSAA